MFEQVIRELANGFIVTIELFVLTLAISLPLGLIISFGSMSKFKPLKVIVKLFVWVIRGTPLMLQLIVFFYGPGLIANWAASTGSTNAIIVWLSSFTVLDRFLAATIMFSINYACYFSEIFRGGIEAIPRGQYEAGQVLGMTKSQVFFKVVLLQVIKNILPPISNEVITLVKDTSLASVIAIPEILMNAKDYSMQGLIWPLFYSAVFYLVFCGGLTLLFSFIEKKLNYYKG